MVSFGSRWTTTRITTTGALKHSFAPELPVAQHVFGGFCARPFGHTFFVWRPGRALVQSLLVQTSLASFGGVVKTFRWVTSLVQVGDILDVTVVNVQPYGLHVHADGVPGLILIPELSWQRVSHPSEVASVHDRIKCKVNRIPPDATEAAPRFTASIRDLHPELNPWRDPSVYAVGTIFSGVVDRQMSYGVFIRHPRETWALLHVDDFDAGATDLPLGDTVDVVITECDIDGQKIRVRLK